MDIASLAMNMNQASLATQISTAVTKMVMDDGKQTAIQITDMISEAVDSNLGNRIDARV